MGLLPRHLVRAGAWLLERPLTLPGVRGSAVVLAGGESARFAAGAGLCASWAGREPEGAAAQALARAVEVGRPSMARDGSGSKGGVGPYSYATALPILQGAKVTGAMLIVGDARDPFAALDDRFLVALGQQVGAALESADLYRRLAERTHEFERLAARMVQQHETERRRLSRELHDETGQVFSAVRLKLGVIREDAASELADSLDDALGLMDTGIRSIRDVTNALRPSLLDDLGLLPALRALVADFGERSGLFSRVTVPEELPRLSDEAEVALFRALQEGLSNVARHADARSVTIKLSLKEGEIMLSVLDDGQGPPDEELAELERRGHQGLAGMRERISALGGTVQMNGASGEGTHLLVHLPVGGGEDS